MNKCAEAKANCLGRVQIHDLHFKLIIIRYRTHEGITKLSVLSWKLSFWKCAYFELEKWFGVFEGSLTGVQRYGEIKRVHTSQAFFKKYNLVAQEKYLRTLMLATETFDFEWWTRLTCVCDQPRKHNTLIVLVRRRKARGHINIYCCIQLSLLFVNGELLRI